MIYVTGMVHDCSAKMGHIWVFFLQNLLPSFSSITTNYRQFPLDDIFFPLSIIVLQRNIQGF